MFLISIHYTQPLEIVDTFLEEHQEFLNHQYAAGTFIFSGRKVPRTGGVILSNLTSQDELEHVLQQDPFYHHEVASYEITEIQITKCDERFEPFLR
ncbi:uncharacterized protein YciI [Paenibacillus shirakamiensis]|uniref:Uncharacterized protein YciI n=1 Tax=Paenibacillus shirakamiensis TaxID=1265935 RepID=A0ABS4JFW3_9BACL|nr:YciI family protein [Paenibacillus shirakamiensis]MBP2000598.1 uncharacterized protein YciI [Paenibacillus shirakamiensis]